MFNAKGLRPLIDEIIMVKRMYLKSVFVQSVKLVFVSLGTRKYPPFNRKLEDDLFALVTVPRKKPLAGRR